ncbi:vacuolar protein sorting-associated protein 33a [Anaeramoeba ignava]|uniref:Vacuolar protein sorting-associated protein 33a n=1 Tax=Anaeramoeba ignava TaxID=1746090 RepID=A0A9Q0R459_ANAIG|nr:vacuolar protein sorting-associated protein 33a [Anaeramoeba ignava]
MSGAINLENSRIIKDLGLIRDEIQQELFRILDSIEGPKGIVFENELMIPLGLIAEFHSLKERLVQNVFSLNSDPIRTKLKTLIFFVRPKMKMMDHIAKHLRFHDTEDKSQKKRCFIYFVPRKTFICEKLLEQAGVKGAAVIREFNLDLIPLDHDVLTLGLETSFKEFISGDTSSLYYVSSSVHKLQRFFGLIPDIKYVGKNGKIAGEMLLRMRRESPIDENIAPKINHVIFIDRNVDLVTPVITQLTYEGLIDEMYTIKHSYVELDGSFLGKDNQTKEKYALNSNDILFEELRDLNMGEVGPFLSQKAKKISQDYNSRHDLQELQEYKVFIGKLPTLQKEHFSLKIHLSIVEDILNKTKDDDQFRDKIDTEMGILINNIQANDTIQNMIYREKPLEDVLRMLCLQSLVNNDFKSKSFDNFRREILETYGFQHIFTLANLEKIGMFKKSEGRSKTRFNFNQLKKSLNLISENFEETKDISSVFSGYAPITVRLVQKAFSSGWQGLEDSVFRYLSDGVFGQFSQENDLSNSEQSMISEKRNVCLVFFINGVTFAEISALRLLSQMQDHSLDYIVATTHIISGKSLIESAYENFDK